MAQDWSNIVAVLMNFALWQKVVNVIIGSFTKGPDDFKACASIYTEGGEVIDFAVHHWNPAQLGVNALANVATHLMELIGDFWDLTTAFFGLNMYKIGYDTGAITITLIN